MNNAEKIKIISSEILAMKGAKLMPATWWTYKYYANCAKRFLGMENPSMSIGNGIVIDSKYKKYSNDWFIKLCHECCHVEQNVKNIQYFASSAYRGKCERDAYMVSIEVMQTVAGWVAIDAKQLGRDMQYKYKMKKTDAVVIELAAVKRIDQVRKGFFTTDIGKQVAKRWGEL